MKVNKNEILQERINEVVLTVEYCTIRITASIYKQVYV